MVIALREVGAKVTNAERIDTRLLIPAEDLKRRGGPADRRSDRADRAALRYAEDLQRSLYERAEAIEADPRAALPRNEPTLKSIWTLYRELNVARVKVETIDRNRKQVRPLIEFFDELMLIKPSAISVVKAERFVTWRLEQAVSPRTVWGELQFLRQILRWAADRSDETGVQAIALNKLPEVRGKRGVKAKVMLTPEQFFALYAAARKLPRRGDILRRIIAFGMCARLRKTPLLALDGAWIDRKRNWLNVPAAFNKGRGDDYRPISVPLPRFAMAMVKDLSPNGPVWPSMFGRRNRSADVGDLVAAVRLTKSDDPERDEMIIVLTKKYRIRVADVADLTWDNVNPIAGWIHNVRVNNSRSQPEFIQLEAEDAGRLARLSERRGKHVAVFVDRKGQQLTDRKVLYLHDRLDALAHVDEKRRTARTMVDVTASLRKACTEAGKVVKMPARLSLHDLRRTGNHILEAHRCPNHPAGVEELVRERLMEHVPDDLRAAYSRVTEEMMREAVAVYDELYQEFAGSGDVVDIAAVRLASPRT